MESMLIKHVLHILYMAFILSPLWTNVLLVLIDIYKATLRPQKDIKKMYGGDWAIVTGATDGIGKAYCFELAEKGFNIVLVSRTQEKLDAVAKELTAKHAGIETKTIMVDFTKMDEVKFLEIRNALSPLSIGVLINNVGMAYPHPEIYHLMDAKINGDLIRVNILSMKTMIDIVLPILLAKKRSKKGAIVNISSGLSYVPGGYLSVYSACKAFVDRFTGGLSEEYRATGVDFQTQHPFLVATKMSRRRRSFGLVPSAAEFAAASVRCIGYGPSEVPHLWHKLQNAALRLVPAPLVAAAMNRVHLAARDGARRKAARTGAASGAGAENGAKQ